jgi:hypothetical protein
MARLCGIDAAGAAGGAPARHLAGGLTLVSAAAAAAAAAAATSGAG